MNLWPATLQQKLNQASFNYKIGDTAITSDMDIGPAKKRRRFTKSVDELSCSIDLEHDDYSTLYTFFDTTLNGGVETFQFDNPFTLATEEFRFKSPPTISPLGGRWYRVEMVWERMPQ